MFLASLFATAVLAGCQPPDDGVLIEATLRGVQDRVEDAGSYVLVRAVPDHKDGFNPGRKYTGPREYADGCPIDHLELPLDFALFGSERHVDGSPDRWLLLAWVTDDPDAIWVAPGELYGTATFEFRRDSWFGYLADGIVVDIENVRE